MKLGIAQDHGSKMPRLPVVRLSCEIISACCGKFVECSRLHRNLLITLLVANVRGPSQSVQVSGGEVLSR